MVCTSAYICFAGMSWCPRVPAAWALVGASSAPIPLRQTLLAAGVHRDRCQGASGIFRGDSPPELFNQAPLHQRRRRAESPSECLRHTLVFPRSVSVSVLCFHITSLKPCFLKQQQRKRNIVSLWLPVLCLPESRACWSQAARWWWDCVCVFSFFSCFLCFWKVEVGEAGER